MRQVQHKIKHSIINCFISQLSPDGVQWMVKEVLPVAPCVNIELDKILDDKFVE